MIRADGEARTCPELVERTVGLLAVTGLNPLNSRAGLPKHVGIDQVFGPFAI
jgi:hypothetical protein